LGGDRQKGELEAFRASGSAFGMQARQILGLAFWCHNMIFSDADADANGKACLMKHFRSF